MPPPLPSGLNIADIDGTHSTESAMKLLLIRNVVDQIAAVRHPNGVSATINHDALLFCLNGAFSIFLVLLGGLFAGLTLAFMGQDRIALQVIAGSGTQRQRINAQKVLNVLSRGRHWVLVSLLLGNVITNETLPIVLDADVKGGWFAVLISTVLIVIFGEIIPQSVCAKHGLAIGAWSSRYVLWVMYILFPIAYPIAALLDRLLGPHHGQIFNRAGLKTLIMLHERLSFSPIERLNREEVTVITSTLDLRDCSISTLMTPLSKLYTLPLNTPLSEITRYNILNSRHSLIPIYMPGHPKSFVGALPVKSLVALPASNLTALETEITIGDLELEKLSVIRPDVSVQEVMHAFRDRSTHMILVTEKGTIHGEPLGIVTARDVMSVLLGDRRASGIVGSLL